jgi:AcrR family transcriptional regulator
MAASGSNRPLRADAARNIDRIISSARECFRDYGPEVPLQVIARRAGVGPATLFRNFADKEELVLAALAQQLRLRVDPLATQALQSADAGQGMLDVVAALLEAASENRNLLLAIGRRRRELLGGAGRPLVDSLEALLLRGQEQGRVRPDVGADDVVPLLAMALGALEATPPGSDGWRRQLALLGDALLLPPAARTLPVPSAQPATENGTGTVPSGVATPDAGSPDGASASVDSFAAGAPALNEPASNAAVSSKPASRRPVSKGTASRGPGAGADSAKVDSAGAGAMPGAGLFSSLGPEPVAFGGPPPGTGQRWSDAFLTSTPSQQADPGGSRSAAQHDHQERRTQP